MANESVYLIPNGPGNLAKVFPGVLWSNVKEYTVQLIDVDNNIVASSTLNVICNCANDEGVLFHFINYLGAFDSIPFSKPKIVHEASGDQFKKGLSYPLNKKDTGIERHNVRGNDTYEVRRNCTQDEMTWLQEAVDSPKAFIEMEPNESQVNDFLPVVVLNAKVEKMKTEKDFRYEFVLQYILSNEYQTIRN